MSEMTREEREQREEDLASLDALAETWYVPQPALTPKKKAADDEASSDLPF